jgi:hypothetical protein
VNKNPYILIVFIVLGMFVLTDCSTVVSGLYGIKKITVIDDKTILRYSKKYHIPLADSYELDTSYVAFLRTRDTSKYKDQIKNHLQPLQALYYDNSNYLVSYHINCFAGGFPNLRWDRNGLFASFPPRQQAPLDSLVALERHLKHLRPISQSNSLSTGGYDLVVIVYWSRFMGRQSKRLIRFVQENARIERDKRVKIIYANTDNLFAMRTNQKKS